MDVIGKQWVGWDGWSETRDGIPQQTKILLPAESKARKNSGNFQLRAFCLTPGCPGQMQGRERRNAALFPFRSALRPTENAGEGTSGEEPQGTQLLLFFSLTALARGLRWLFTLKTNEERVGRKSKKMQQKQGGEQQAESETSEN
jgi:hypothetical protein